MDERQTLGVLNMFKCGTKLEAKSETVTSAIVYYHRFFEYATEQDQHHDHNLVAATCLYLAGKTEEEHLAIRDIINVFRSTLNGPDAKPLPLSERYWNLRDSIVQMELIILRALRFRVKIEPHPHRYLVHYLHTINEWSNFGDKRAQLLNMTCWTLLNDSYLNPKIIKHKPVPLVIAVISLASQLTQIEIKGDEGEENVPWYERFADDLSSEDLKPIMNDVVDAYIMAEKLKGNEKRLQLGGGDADSRMIDD